MAQTRLRSLLGGLGLFGSGLLDGLLSRSGLALTDKTGIDTGTFGLLQPRRVDGNKLALRSIELDTRGEHGTVLLLATVKLDGTALGENLGLILRNGYTIHGGTVRQHGLDSRDRNAKQLIRGLMHRDEELHRLLLTLDLDWNRGTGVRVGVTTHCLTGVILPGRLLEQGLQGGLRINPGTHEIQVVLRHTILVEGQLLDGESLDSPKVFLITAGNGTKSELTTQVGIIAVNEVGDLLINELTSDVRSLLDHLAGDAKVGLKTVPVNLVQTVLHILIQDYIVVFFCHKAKKLKG